MWCQASQETLRLLFPLDPRMNSKKLHRVVTPNDPSPKETVMINLEDPRSVFQLLRLLESQLDKNFDDIRYVSSITMKRGRRGAN